MTEATATYSPDGVTKIPVEVDSVKVDKKGKVQIVLSGTVDQEDLTQVNALLRLQQGHGVCAQFGPEQPGETPQE